MAVRHATVKSTEVAHSEGTFNSTFKIGTNVTIGQGTYNDATGEVDFLNANIKTTGNVSGASPSLSEHLATKGYVDSRIEHATNSTILVEAEQNDPPSSPNDTEKWIVGTSPTGAWSGHAKQIAEWNEDTTVWEYTMPDEGMTVYDQNEDIDKIYNGSEWIDKSTTIKHNSAPDLNTGNYHHLTPTEYSALTGGGDASSEHNHASLYAAINHNHDGTYAPVSHTHTHNDITDFQNSVASEVTYENLDNNGDVGTGSDQVAKGNHLHTGVYADASHTHPTGDIVGLGTYVDGRVTFEALNNNSDIGTGSDQVAKGDHNHDGDYAPASHTHTPSDITGLQSYVDNRVTYETLNTNGDVGTNADQVARGNHTHNYVDEVPTATEDNIAVFTDDGNIKDSGSKTSDFASASHTHDTFEGAITLKKVTVTHAMSPYTIPNNVGCIEFDTTSGSVRALLPDADTSIRRIIDAYIGAGTNDAELKCNSGDTFDGTKNLATLKGNLDPDVTVRSRKNGWSIDSVDTILSTE